MVRRALARKNFCGMAATPLGYKPNPQLFLRFRHRLSTTNGSFSLSSAGRCLYNPRPQQAVCMPKKNQKSHPGSAQILLFPTGAALQAKTLSVPNSPETSALVDDLGAQSRDRMPACEVVLSGSFRRDTEGLRRMYEELKDLGCAVLSPRGI